MSKARGILFSAPMVRAIRRKVNAKTVTRRLVKPQPVRASIPGAPGPETAWPWRMGIGYVIRSDSHGPPPEWAADCPYGQPGDVLWVRETWQYADWTEDGYPLIRYRTDGAERWIDQVPEEATDTIQDDWARLSDPKNFNIDNKAADRRWRSPMFMPRWASRITLEVVSVRAERVQDITEDDAIAEGVETHAQKYGVPEMKLHGTTPWYRYDGEPCSAVSAVESYHTLWESINGKGSWTANPWVWRIEFRRIK